MVQKSNNKYRTKPWSSIKKITSIFVNPILIKHLSFTILTFIHGFLDILELEVSFLKCIEIRMENFPFKKLNINL